MDMVYTARYLLPMVGAPIEDGAVSIRGGRIVSVGRRQDLPPASAGAAVHDFGDAVLLPPMVNAHTHLELTDFPRWAKELGETGEPGSFTDWVLRVIRVKRGIDPERYRPSLEEGIRRSLLAGTGAVGDVLSWFPAREAYQDSPLYGRLFLETLGRDPEIGRRVLGTIGRILDKGGAWRLQFGVSPHSPYTLSAEYLEDVLDFVRRRSLPASMHFAESPEEVAFLLESEGDLARVLYPFVGWGDMLPPPARRRPAPYLAERGGLVPWNLLAHGVQVEGSDFEALASAGSPVVLCPRSNARLKVGRPPAARYLKSGIPLALGTDSLASNDSLSVWDELAFAASWLEEAPPEALLQAATLGGARALGLDGEMGALQPGWGGHFQVLRPKVLPPLDELFSFLCAPGRGAEVAALVLDGREVLPKG
mgnify:CR=1 FL=1